MLRVAVIGLGIGEQHARVYAASEGCVLQALYDLDSNRANGLAEKLGQGSAVGSFESILRDRAIDVVSIASYDDVHFDQTLDALQAGKHVFVEKPLCRSMEELLKIRKTWDTAGTLHLASNLVLRAAPLYRWLKEEIETGRLGEIFVFDGDYLYGRLERITDGWRAEVDQYSVMLGGAIHLVDLMLWLTGQKPVAVVAVGNRICTTGTRFAYNDFVSAFYRFESGLVGRITANFGCVHRHQHVLRVFGTKGTFLYDDRGSRVYRSRDPELEFESSNHSPLPASKGALIPEFLKGILEKKNPRPSAEREFDVIAACIAADRSVKEGTPVQVEYV